MSHGLFEVIGRRQYRGHRPGDQFEARYDPAIDRAICRKDIRFVKWVESCLPQGHWLPKDWPPQAADTAQTEAPQGASLMKREKVK